MFWSTWSSPSSSASAAASSALESRKKRPTFEDFRAQEPPQARLIRLRGLFDTLLDSDDENALAGGRAKDEWTKSAMRARYGAGGSMARGSLAPEGNPKGDPNQNLNASTSDSTSSSTSSSSSTSKRVPPPLPAPPLKQSYASELLSQCRACRKEVEDERERERKSSLGNDSEGWNWNDLIAWVPGVASSSSPSTSSSPSSSGKDQDSKNKDQCSASSSVENLKETFSNLTSSSSSSASSPTKSSSSSTPDQSSSSNSSTSSSAFSAITSLFSSSSSTTESFEHHTTDQEGEAGWTGSKVWGLSAVGNRQREKDRELDERISKGQLVADDGGKRQRQIEWEGFLKYAEGKERGEC